MWYAHDWYDDYDFKAKILVAYIKILVIYGYLFLYADRFEKKYEKIRSYGYFNGVRVLK